MTFRINEDRPVCYSDPHVLFFEVALPLYPLHDKLCQLVIIGQLDLSCALV